MVSAYEVIEEIKKAGGKIKRGLNETIKAVERGDAKLVFYASNVNPKELVKPLPELCKEKGINYIEVDSKEKLGIAAGLNVSAAAIAVVDLGKAEKIVNDFLKK
ncbi:MAG: ribosomal L7Ae/L30e/S12e/Gadd45 family protein [Candidatus Pacearchaeota archaeon]